MPFTGSHPAAVVPLMRVGLVPSALVIGSMVPDLPYYVPVPVNSVLTHNFVGVFSVDLVLGLICFAVWQILLTPVAVALAPEGFRRRLAPRYPARWREHLASARAMVMVAASLVFGATTHVVWDAFTHQGRFGAHHIAWLAHTHGGLAGFSWAQYASGLFGLAVMAWAAGRWWRTTPESDGQRIPRLGRTAVLVVWSAVLLATAFAGLLGLLDRELGGHSFGNVGYRAATWGGAAGLTVALLCAVVCLLVLIPAQERRLSER